MAYLTPSKKETTKSGLLINEFLLSVNNPSKISLPAKRTSSQPLIGVTLHNTNWLDVNAATTPAEQYTRATYNGNMGDTRIHYYVDDKCAWRNFDDSYTTWHAATGGQGQGNCNTISIESIMRNQTDAVSVASMENTAKLIAWIFDQYGWTVEKNLYTHNYWTNWKATGVMSTDLDAQSLKKCTSSTANPSGKYCPVYLLPQWEKFKALIKKYMGTTTSGTTTPSTTTPSIPVPTVISDIPKFIWDYFKGKGLNVFAISGLMGNLYAESGLLANNLQNTYEKSLVMTDAQYTTAVDNGSYKNFVQDKAGYGLAQWTYWSRKEALLNFAKAAKTSIGDLPMQLDFLWKELQGYKNVISVLGSATSVRQASDVVLLDFERPADQSEAVKVKRASYGQSYYDKYAGKTTVTTPPPTTTTSTIKANDTVNLADNATYYDGGSMPTWVKAQKWIVKEVKGDRAVIDKSVDGKNSINSAVNIKFLSIITTTTTPPSTPAFTEYKIKVTTADLNIRKGPGTNYGYSDIQKNITDQGIYTIVEENTGTGATKWGRLKSGAGWISLDFTKKV